MTIIKATTNIPAHSDEDVVLFRAPSRPTEFVTMESLFGFPVTGKYGPVKVQRYLEGGERTPLVDTAWVHDPSYVRAVLAAWQRYTPLAMFGPPGTGKSEGLEQLFAQLNCEAVIVQLTEETEVADLIGEKSLEVRDGATCSTWVDGPITEAFRKGLPVVLNELDYPRPGVLTEANTFFRSEFMTLKANGGELVNRHADTMFFGTLNTVGMGDQDGGFSGVQSQNAATMNRLRWFKVGYPTLEKEVDILNKAEPKLQAINPEFPELLVKFASMLRAHYEHKALPLPFGVRSLVDCAEIAVDYHSIEEGICQTIYNRLTDEVQRELVRQAYQNAFTFEWSGV